MVYIGSGIQSYSTNDVGNDSYATEHGGSLTLANAGAIYTIDELDTNDTEIDDDDETSNDNTFGIYGSSLSLSDDQDYELAVQAIGSLTEAGTDTVTSYSDGMEYSGSGASDWQYEDFDDGDVEAASGSGSTESDLDLYGTYYSDADSGPETSITYDTYYMTEWNGSATDTGDTVDGGFDPYSVNTHEEYMSENWASGTSANEDGEYEYSEIRSNDYNQANNEAGSQAEDPADWTDDGDAYEDYTVWVEGDNGGTSSSGSGSHGGASSGPYVVQPGDPVYPPTPSGVPLGTTDLLEALDQLETPTLPITGYPPEDFGFEQGALPHVTLAYKPDTSVIKGDGLPETEVSQLTNVQGTGSTYDDVSRGAPPTASAMLIALAVAGRNPADIVIPTNGSRASGGGEGTSGSGSSSSSSSSGFGSGGTSGGRSSGNGSSGGSPDAVVAKAGGSSPSGVMVSQGVVSLPGSEGSGGDGATTAGSTSAGTSESQPGAGDSGQPGVVPDDEPPGGDGGGDGDGGRAGGSHFTEADRVLMQGMGYTEGEIDTAAQMAENGKSQQQVMEEIGPPRGMAPTERWEPATIKARSPDDVVVEIVEKVEPVVRPVMVYGGAVVSMAGHAGGAVAGSALILDPDPSASKAVGYYMLVVNADGFVADIMTLRRGEPVPTVLNQGVKAGLIKLGRTESQAEQGAAVFEFYSNTFQAGKMAMMLPLGAASNVQPLTLEISAGRYPGLTENIYNAQMAGHPVVLTYGGNAAANRAAALEGVPSIAGLSRDEYPFASTLEGGRGSWVGHISPAEQSAQGGILKNFYRQNNIQPGTQFRVIIGR